MYKSQTFRKGSIFVLAVFCGILFSSCTEKLSGVGSGYLRDTITSGLTTFADSSAFVFKPVVKRTAIAAGQNINLNISSTELLLGKVQGDAEAWTALKFPIFPDSIGTVLTDSLILSMRFPFEYGGDGSDPNIDFSVWAEIPDNNVVNDSTISISLSNLKQIVGSYHGSKGNDSLLSISIGLDTSVINTLLRTSSLALVLVPNAGMKTIRGFASNENGDNTFAPTLKCLVRNTASHPDTITIFRNPTIDLYVVTENSTPPPTGEFIVRGSYAERERIVIDMKNMRNQLQLNPFTTINSALLQVRSDSKLHTSSNMPVDTFGPTLAYIPNTSVADSGHSFFSYGSPAATDAALYSFQIQSLVEHALRVGDDSLVLELRSGFTFRSFNGSTFDVEDYNINRWVFYGMDNADKTKRPKLSLTYSYLR